MKDFAQKQLKIKTYTGYEKSLERINQAIGHIKLKDLRTGHLNEFYRNLEETGIRADLKYTSKIDIGEAIKQAGVTRTASGRRPESRGTRCGSPSPVRGSARKRPWRSARSSA